MIPLTFTILLLLCFHVFFIIVIKYGRDTMPEEKMGTQISTHWRALLRTLSHHIIFEPGSIQGTKQRIRSVVVKLSQYQSGRSSTPRGLKRYFFFLDDYSWCSLSSKKHPHFFHRRKTVVSTVSWFFKLHGTLGEDCFSL